jgi:hypothetical protein
MFLVRRSGSEAVPKLYGTSLPKTPRKLAAGGFCGNGSRQINEPSLMIRTILKSSVATAGDDIGYITA